MIAEDLLARMRQTLEALVATPFTGSPVFSVAPEWLSEVASVKGCNFAQPTRVHCHRPNERERETGAREIVRVDVSILVGDQWVEAIMIGRTTLGIASEPPFVFDAYPKIGPPSPEFAETMQLCAKTA